MQYSVTALCKWKYSTIDREIDWKNSGIVVYLGQDNPTMSKGKHNFHLKGKREFYFL